MEKFLVSGMSCAACSAHVEKAVRELPGVKEVSVSLLTGSMQVEYGEPATSQAICRAVEVPTVAIGGISEQNILQLKGSGVDGVAVVSAIFGAEDPGAAAARLAALSSQLAE